MVNMIYIKPKIYYWTALEIESIEARMSNSAGSVLTPLERFINLIRAASTYNEYVFNRTCTLATNILHTLEQDIIADGFTEGSYILSHGFAFWSTVDYRAALLKYDLDTLSLNIAVHNYNYNFAITQRVENQVQGQFKHEYEYIDNQCKATPGWVAIFAYGMQLDQFYLLKTNCDTVSPLLMSYNGCEVIACYNVLLYIYNHAPSGHYYVYKSLIDLAYYFERHGSILYGKYGTFISDVTDYINDLLQTKLGEDWSAHLFADYSASDYDLLFEECKTGIFSFFWSGDLYNMIHSIMLYKGQVNGTTVVKTLNLIDDDADPAFFSNQNYCFSSIQDLVTRYNLTPVSFVRIVNPAGALL